MHLPEIAYSVRKQRSEIVAVRGLNYSDRIQDGDLRDAVNLSARRYPYLSTRHARARQKKNTTDYYTGGTALTAWNKLVAVEGTNLLYDGAAVGTVTAGAKQFAMVNTKLVIWPDKVYLDMETKKLVKMNASVSVNGANVTETSMRSLDSDKTSTAWPNLSNTFKAGDVIKISGCIKGTSNNKTVTIADIGADGQSFSAKEGFVARDEASSTVITLERVIPEMDFICESENRLWGCSNGKQTIYASALGEPTHFDTFEGLTTDSYAVAVGTEGDFTGCCKLGSSVLFWKETKLHKMLGSYPSEYALYTYSIEGLKAGCHKSLQVINEVLFYMGLHGVYAFSGGVPALLSDGFGEKQFTNAVGGSDGDTYFLSVAEGSRHHLFTYETDAGIWMREDDTAAVDFARIGKDLYFMDSAGAVWLADSGEDDPALEWTAQFTPFYETIEGRKACSRLLLRLELPKGSWLTAEIRCDGGAWRTCGRLAGQTYDTVPLRVAPNRCDRYELRLRGKGPCTVLSVLREFRIGSDV